MTLNNQMSLQKMKIKYSFRFKSIKKSLAKPFYQNMLMEQKKNKKRKMTKIKYFNANSAG